MRISDWSSDVCSSDLGRDPVRMVLGDETPVGGDDLFVAGITVHAEGFMPGSRLLRRPPPTRGFIALCGGFGIFLARLARVGDENGDQPVAAGDRQSTRLNYSH